LSFPEFNDFYWINPDIYQILSKIFFLKTFHAFVLKISRRAIFKILVDFKR